MPEFDKPEHECKTDFDKWMYIMNRMEKLKEIPWQAQNELFVELSKVSNVAALSPEERFAYEENLRMYRDNLACAEAAYLDGHDAGYESGFSEGRESGFSEGHESGFSEGKIDVAKTMIASGMSDTDIAKMTKLTLENVRKLRES